MVATKKYLKHLREKSFIHISKEKEKIILDKLGKDPEPDENGHFYTYTDQDIWEQIRKILDE